MPTGEIPTPDAAVEAQQSYFPTPQIRFRDKIGGIRRSAIVPEHTDIVRPAYAPDEFAGRNVLITGLSHLDGFAYASAVQFVDLDAGSLAFVYRTPSDEVDTITQNLQELAKGRDTLILPIQADISKPDSAKSILPRMLDQTGTVHVYIDNAGRIAMGTLAEQAVMPTDEVLLDLMTNVVGPHLILGDVAKTLQEQGDGGRVVSIISPAADGVGRQTRYAGPKAFKFAAMRGGAMEATEDNMRGKKPEILYVSIAPGFAVTHMTDEPVPEQARRGLLNILGQERILTSAEIADYIVYASSRHLPEDKNGQVITAMRPMLDEAPVVEVQEAEVVDQPAEEPFTQNLASGGERALDI